MNEFEAALAARIEPALRTLHPRLPSSVVEHEAKAIARAIAPLVRAGHHEDPDDVNELMGSYGGDTE